MNLPFNNLVEIKGGLSKKKVFRKSDKKLSKIVIDFSKDEREFKNFFIVYDILKKINISIPKIHEVYSKKKIVVLEDFGNNKFDNIVNDKKLYNLLKLAVDNIIIIQNSITKIDLINLERYTYNTLIGELYELIQYYIPYKKINDFPENNFIKLWEITYNSQNFNFDSFVHKDYEFVNLIFLNKNNLHLKCGIIDFQSAFLGFKGWDLFSILENPRVNFTRKYNEDLIKYFFDNVGYNSDYETFRSQYYILNLARQTRLLGRWAKLFHEGKKEYLNYMYPTKQRIIASLNNIENNNLKKIYKKYILN